MRAKSSQPWHRNLRKVRAHDAAAKDAVVAATRVVEAGSRLRHTRPGVAPVSQRQGAKDVGRPGGKTPGKRTTPAGGESGGRHLGAARGGGAGPRQHGRERSVTSMVYPKRAEGKLACPALRQMMKTSGVNWAVARKSGVSERCRAQVSPRYRSITAEARCYCE